VGFHIRIAGMAMVRLHNNFGVEFASIYVQLVALASYPVTDNGYGVVGGKGQP
jgi:hypothetical protein